MDIVVCIGDGADENEASRLADHLDVMLTDKPGDELTLLLDSDGLSLCGFGLKFRGDFERMIPRITNGRLNSEMLIHAAKPKKSGLSAIDATVGMGEDALLLAAAGYDVTMYERNPVIAALLRDALRRASQTECEQLKDAISKMRLFEGDSTELIKSRSERADLVYLDPMFPARKKSGLINKKLQLIQKLEQPCVDETAMLDAAMAAHPEKIIIKRPLHGEFLAGVKPGYTIKGKAVRYDCIVVPKKEGRDADRH